MLNRWKRLLALLASVAVLFSLCTAASAAPGGQAEPRELTAADYAAADAIFASLPSADGTNGGTGGLRPTRALCDWLETADGVRPGTVSANGSCVTWQTDAGITCSYNPQLERISERAQEPAQTETLESIPALRGVQHGRDVYLFQPYYGLDSSFTRQYYEEGQRIAAKSEGTFYYYKTEAATVDAIADAVESGGVILFDSHGTTDYTGDNEDYTSKATTSYLCLQSGEGLTTEDYADGHAVYGGSGINGMRYYEVDGTVIANHMEKPANGGLVWMAICLGMATDGLEGPLMDAGVGVVYGYSQSVTFIGDYCFEEEFFNKLLQGGTVAESIRTMKARYGQLGLLARHSGQRFLPDRRNAGGSRTEACSLPHRRFGGGRLSRPRKSRRRAGGQLRLEPAGELHRDRDDGRPENGRNGRPEGHDGHGRPGPRLLCRRRNGHPGGGRCCDAGGRPVPHLVPARGLHDHDPLLCQDASCAALCRAGRRHAGGYPELCRGCGAPAASRRDPGSGCAGLFLCGLVPAGAGGAD